jgi:hypothetical protein
MISIFPLWTFHLYVAAFQKQLHMEYISLSWYDIPELVVPILDRGLLLTRKLLNQGFHLLKLKSSLPKFYGRHHDLVDCYGISVTNNHGYVPLVVSTSQSFPHSWLITVFVTRLTRLIPLVKQELPTLPEHLSSPPVFSGVRVTRSLVLCVVFCRSLFVLLSFFIWSFRLSFFDLRILITPLISLNSFSNISNTIWSIPSNDYVLWVVVWLLVLFLLVIVLSFLLRYTDSGDTFGVFKLFLYKWGAKHTLYRGPTWLNELGSWIT